MFHIDIITCCIASWERVPFPSFVITHHNIPCASFVPSQIFCSFHVKKRNLDLSCIFRSFSRGSDLFFKEWWWSDYHFHSGTDLTATGNMSPQTKLIARKKRRRIFCQSQNFFLQNLVENTKWGGLRGGNMSPQTKLIKRKGENEKGKSQARTKIIPTNFVVKLSKRWFFRFFVLDV